MITMPNFKRIVIKDWRQFHLVDMEIHPRLTVITGSNGAGKSTVLNIFSQHFGFTRPFLSTPKPIKGGGYFFDLGFQKRINLRQVANGYITYEYMEDEEEYKSAPVFTGQMIDFGEIFYSSDFEGKLRVPESQAQSYNIQILNQQHVPGVFVGSHRAMTNYQQISNISLQPVLAVQAYNLFNQEIINRFGGGYTGFSPIYRMKESLIGMAAFGEGNSYLQRNEEVLETFKGFIEVLRQILPEEIGFKTLVIRIPDVVVQTASGDFMLDSSSGGINAILEMAWQIYLFSKMQSSQNQGNFVVTMDEPENHLHPSMQRAIIPNLLQAFPNAQFIVATHSPFVVSAVEDSIVHVLKYQDGSSGVSAAKLNSARRKVDSVKLDGIHKGGSASEVLREVLGVPVTTPVWVESKIDDIVSKYLGKPISTDLLNKLRQDLSDGGFGELYPDALSKIVEANPQT